MFDDPASPQSPAGWVIPAVPDAQRHPPPELQQIKQKNLRGDASRSAAGSYVLHIVQLQLQQFSETARR
jgi:hypothetical protein